MATKTVCPVTREQFLSKAHNFTIKVFDNDGKEVREFKASPRTFSTQSLGYNVNDKLTTVVDGKVVTLQVGMNLTVVGSKELPA